MAWVTEINADEQVDYRLSRQAGCGVVDGAGQQVEAGQDDQVDYRLESDADGVLVWVGSGLDAVGLKAGTVMTPEGEAAARRLMKGCHPATGARLITTKTSVRADEKATLTVAPLLRAIEVKAAEAGVEPAALLEGKPKQQKVLAQQQRMVNRKGEAQRLHIETVRKLARATGIDLDAVYGTDAVEFAWKHRDLRVDSRVRGWDIVLDLTKSDSTLDGLMPDFDERTYREIVHQAKDETLRMAEQLVGYAVGSEDGEPVRIATGGLLGWSVEHRAARPMGDGQPGDPHLHLHVVIANLALCEDGKWRSIANSGRDLYRHAAVLDAVFKGRVRQLTYERFGVRRVQAERTRAWEIDGIPGQLRDAFSRRGALVTETAGENASLEDKMRISAKTRRAKHTADAHGMRASWRERAEALGIDVDAMVAEAAPGPPGPDGEASVDGPGGPRIPPPDIAAVVFDPDSGVTATKKAFTRAELMAAVVNALPYGAGSAELTELQHLVDDVLRVEGYAVPLPHLGSTVMSSTDRYTTRDVLAAEEVAVTQARARAGDNTVRLTTEQADAAMSVFSVAAGFELSEQQREVVTRLLTAGNGIDAVVGVAGAGKSTLMDACRIAWDATGTTYAGACLSAVGAQGLQDASAIPSRTVASWLKRIESGEGLTGIDVLVVDEAVMTDDRSAAKLLTEAARTGTQVIAIGDPKQLQAVGIGGWFAEVHRLVAGLTLDENRRQRDEAERAALDIWRTGDHRKALEMLAAAERVHPAATADEARSQMLMAWDKMRDQWPNELDLLDNLAVLAARNDDVDLLNAGAQEMRRQNGELGDTMHTYALPGGRALVLAENDVVRVRVNDYRSRRDPDQPDILNGYRAKVTAITEDHRVQITWRAKDPSSPTGTKEVSAWMAPEDIAGGALSLGYAMTVAASQGMTCHTSLLYGHGCNAFATYPGITRGKEANHLWLPLDVVEDEHTQRELGRARTETELLQRSIHAFADYLGQSKPDGMISDELRAAPEPVALPRHTERLTAREEHEAALRNASAARERTVRAARSKSPSMKRQLWEDAARRAERASAEQERRQDDSELPAYDIGETSADGPQWSEEHQARLDAALRVQELRAIPSAAKRPYGDLSDQELRTRMGIYLEAAETAEALAAEAREEYRQRHEALERDTDAGTTRGREFATRADVALTAAEALLTRAREETDAAAEAAKKAKELRSQYDKTAAARKAGHITLALAFTTKKAVKETTDKLVEQRMEAEAEEMRAKRAAEDTRTQAWDTLTEDPDTRALGATSYRPATVEDLATKLQELRTALPDRAQAIDTGDLRRRNDAHGRIESNTKEAAAFRGYIDTARQEQAYRRTIRELSPDRHNEEARYRADQAKQDRQVQHQATAPAVHQNEQQSRGQKR